MLIQMSENVDSSLQEFQHITSFHVNPSFLPQDFPAGPMAKNPPSNTGLISSQGTKIPHVMGNRRSSPQNVNPDTFSM